jgi:uncharacterized protein
VKSDVTYLGMVRRVIGAKILVEVSPDIPSASPIIDGRVHRLGQVGSFVRISVGLLNLFGTVSMVGASPVPRPDELDSLIPRGERWIEVQLVGESYGTGPFHRGVSLFPTLDDEVHVVTANDLSVIYGGESTSDIAVGYHAASENLKAYLDVDKLVTRHSAIVGSTGSGKSNTVAGLLTKFASGEFPNARVVIIDPHGEYAGPLGSAARIFSLGDADHPLLVPYWALSFDELAWFLVDRRTGTESTQDAMLREQILEQRRKACNSLKSGKIAESDITADSPVPFDVRDLWYYFDRRERATYTDIARTSEALVKEGDSKALGPAKFTPASLGSASPYKPLNFMSMGAYPNKILSRLKDPRFDFFLSPGKYNGVDKDLDDLATDWFGHERAVTVFDLAGVPFNVTDLLVGAIARILFELMFWGRNLAGVGRDRPLLIVFEEAHTYLPGGQGNQFVVGYALRAVQRIFREGRKYGVGAMVVSQRPTELDQTVLSQCGTFFALRLTNSEDQGRVKASSPDALAGLLDLLPALRTGEALILGEAVAIPSRVRLPLVEPRPDSHDPEVAQRWRATQLKQCDYAPAVTGWRKQQAPIEEEKKTE